MKRIPFICLILLVTCGCQQPAENLQVIADDYVNAWTHFYPSLALSAGKTEAAFLLENYPPQKVADWLVHNQQTLERIVHLPKTQSLDERIDSQLLKRQIQRELFRWGEFQVHKNEPLIYSDLINHSLTPVLVRQNLSKQQKVEAVIARLQGLQKLCDTAQANLSDGRPASTEAAIRDIRSTSDFIQNGLVSALEVAPDMDQHDFLIETCTKTASRLIDLAQWLEDELSPRISLHDAYGEPHYTAELALVYGPDMTPAKLEQIASAEILTVRGLMDLLARDYWRQTRTQPIPAEFAQLMQTVLTEMESDRAQNQQEFLQVFVDLIDRSEQFLKENDLIDLPQHRSLFTDLSPSHFAGAAVGGVYSAGPFDPEAETLFYLPTVPDSAAQEAKDGFYRSFNNPFNTMIITHEIYPGHYLQLKAAAYHNSRIRALFAGDDFTEGWASYCEQMMLDEGWNNHNPMTRLAHLRKRLENAVRAYASVQVHCHGWGRDEMQTFAVETGLLPPQFAENLWRRVLLSPIQLPSYFVGFRQFVDAQAFEQERLGGDFTIKAFNNKIVESGGIPMEMLQEYLAAQPN